MEEATKAVAVRVRQAILGIKHQADPGRVSQMGADQRFLLFGVNPIRKPIVQEPEPSGRCQDRQAAPCRQRPSISGWIG